MVTMGVMVLVSVNVRVITLEPEVIVVGRSTMITVMAGGVTVTGLH